MKGTLVTLDTDWAADAAIDEAASILIEHGTKATWFITHASAAIDRLRERPDLFELGIHPNFLPGSSHGSTTDEVLAYCMRLVPDAKAMRTHSLVQSTPIIHAAMQTTPIESDYSILLVHARDVQPAAYPFDGRAMLRVPTIWADDVEMARPKPSWNVNGVGGNGIRAFDFHPIHVFLNSASMKPYGALKEAVKPLNTATREQMAKFVHRGEGARTAFVSLVEVLGRAGGGLLARDVLAHSRTENPT